MCKVVIVGSGAAGTAAANALLNSGLFREGEIVMLEAQSYTGGRTISIDVGGCPLDLGASWIEDAGRNSKGELNPMLALASEYLVEHGRRGGGRSIRATSAPDTDPSALHVANKRNKAATKHVMCVRQQLLRDPSLPDMCMEEAYAQGLAQFPPPSNDVLKWLNFHKSLGEQYYGDSFHHLSVRSWSSPTTYDGCDVWVEGGYGNIVKKHLEAAVVNGLELRLETAVQSLQQTGNGVLITTEANERIVADYVISTVSLGVLKAGSITFSPPLPPHFQGAIDLLGFGLMNKVILEFEDCFWGDCSNIAIACEERGRWRSWIAPFVDQPPFVLVCLVGCFAAKGIEEMTDDEIVADVLPLLHKAVCPQAAALPRLLSFHFSRWQGNKYIKGGYSSYTVGSSPSTVAVFKEPLWGSRLLFAGEHTDVDYCSVHGAHNSGLRAASQVISSIYS